MISLFLRKDHRPWWNSWKKQVGFWLAHIAILITSEASLLGLLRGPSSHLEKTKCLDSLIKGTVKKIEYDNYKKKRYYDKGVVLRRSLSQDLSLVVQELTPAVFTKRGSTSSLLFARFLCCCEDLNCYFPHTAKKKVQLQIPSTVHINTGSLLTFLFTFLSMCHGQPWAKKSHSAYLSGMNKQDPEALGAEDHLRWLEAS